MSQKAILKKWLKTNDSYFQSNPEMLRSMLNDPAFLVRFNQMLSNKRGRLERKIAKVESRRKVGENVSARKRAFPPIKLPSLSQMSERLNDVNEMIGFIRELTRK